MPLSVLLVEDDPDVGLFFTQVFDALDTSCRLDWMETGDRAMAYLADRSPLLVVTDLGLPGKNGFEIIEWLKVNRPEIEVVMLSGSSNPADKRKCGELNVPFWEKSMAFNHLGVLLGNMMQKCLLSRAA